MKYSKDFKEDNLSNGVYSGKKSNDRPTPPIVMSDSSFTREQ